ncbi:MAG TPA: FAD-dependent oxidoreductase, partial [Methanomassiliicoccales archaeon]|nr:FAD-dependent oxidoreductase [Methanomassiliicoccales archaeon]
IAVVGDEEAMPYSRCYLTDYISGRYTEKNLTYRPPAFYDRNRVQLLLGRKAVSLNPSGKVVLLDDGSKLVYRKLLLATGSSAVLHELRGRELPGVHVLRTFKDARAISSEVSDASSAVVMGGGLVGIGAAIALHERRLKVHLAVASHQVLSQNIDRAAADLVVEHLRRTGIDVHLGSDVVEVLGPQRARGARLSDGKVLECDLVVSAKGVRMNADLAASAGLSVRRGVVVDDLMRTSSPGVHAAGDVAEAKELISGRAAPLTLWPIAYEQGRFAGESMAGGGQAYPGGVQISAVSFLGLPLVSIGETREPKDPSGMRVRVEGDPGRSYRKLVLKDGRVIGAIMVGGLDQGEAYAEMPCTRIDARRVRGLLLKEDLDFVELAEVLLVKGTPPSRK